VSGLALYRLHKPPIESTEAVARAFERGLLKVTTQGQVDLGRLFADKLHGMMNPR
jgi:hypothetical protein